MAKIIDNTSTGRNLRLFEHALRGESRESVARVAGPLHDEFGVDALRVLRFVQTTAVIAQVREERWIKRAFWVGYGLATGVSLIIFTIWRVWS
jgi:hypothetical protein